MKKWMSKNFCAIATLCIVLATSSLIGSYRNSKGNLPITEAPVTLTETPSRLLLSRREKIGLTICGLQPGDKLDDVLRELPPEIDAEEVFTSRVERRFILHLNEMRVVSLASDATTGLIARVGSGLGIPHEVSIERSGVVLCRGGQTWSQARRAVNPSGNSGSSIVEDGLELHLESVTPDRWIGVSLTKVSDAVKAQDSREL